MESVLFTFFEFFERDFLTAAPTLGTVIACRNFGTATRFTRKPGIKKSQIFIKKRLTNASAGSTKAFV